MPRSDERDPPPLLPDETRTTAVPLFFPVSRLVPLVLPPLFPVAFFAIVIAPVLLLDAQLTRRMSVSANSLTRESAAVVY
jgi:hypothetical protein